MSQCQVRAADAAARPSTFCLRMRDPHSALAPAPMRTAQRHFPQPCTPCAREVSAPAADPSACEAPRCLLPVAERSQCVARWLRACRPTPPPPRQLARPRKPHSMHSKKMGHCARKRLRSQSDLLVLTTTMLTTMTTTTRTTLRTTRRRSTTTMKSAMTMATLALRCSRITVGCPSPWRTRYASHSHWHGARASSFAVACLSSPCAPLIDTDFVSSSTLPAARAQGIWRALEQEGPTRVGKGGHVHLPKYGTRQPPHTRASV